ncbi:DNA-directed RNA polymerase subunit beta [Geothrix fuzhouensis]|uniref:DNA-directed RNA polymerase subunit beta n=1 Tax=Geothrix fuzhouensis TaxID=2966451 RepID=UPI002148FFE6|nr:DNA-directed RNA polymerase subunit beta [Geothrix fuzhouensis]
MSVQQNIYRQRHNFSKIRSLVPIPNLIDIQKRSYDEFLQMNLLHSERETRGLKAVFESMFPVHNGKNPDGTDATLEVEFLDYTVGHWACKCEKYLGLEHLRTACKQCGHSIVSDHPKDPTVDCPKCGTRNKNAATICDVCQEPVSMKQKMGMDECVERGSTMAAPLKIRVRLNQFEKDDKGNRRFKQSQDSEVYFGDLPIMTDRGTFIINGTERVIVSQLHRSPGVFFSIASDKSLYSSQIIPYRGSWIEFELDSKGLLYARIDRKRKFLGATFMRALGLFNEDLGSNEAMLRHFYAPATFFLKKGKLSVALSDLLAGRKLGEAVKHPKTKEEILAKDKKITRRVLEQMEKAGIKDVPVEREMLDGAVLLQDIVNMGTGEVLMEANEPFLQTHLEMFLANDIQSFDVCFPEADLTGKVFSETLAKDHTEDSEEAAKELFKKIRPGEPATLESSKKLLFGMFFDPQKYDLSKVGRHKINAKLGLSTDLDFRTLGTDDFVKTVHYLLRLKKYDTTRQDIGEIAPVRADDIDHLGNRRVRSVGELLENGFRVGLVRVQRAIKEKFSIAQDPNSPLQAHDLINSKPVIAAMKEFFGSSQLSQFMDQTNPLSEITHKRRLSALGPGGLSRDRAGFEVRDVHTSHYGRICPIETPEGPNIGLISSLSCYARINEFGFIESPYLKVENGRIVHFAKVTSVGDSKFGYMDVVRLADLEDENKKLTKAGKRAAKFEMHAFYLSAWEEDEHVIAQANVPVDAEGAITEEDVTVRVAGETKILTRDKVTLMDVSPKQVVSVAASLIPFLENDDANRALMGANMQRQAVPLIRTEAPIVGTGMEYVAAKDSGACVVCRRSGIVETVDANRIVVRVEDDPETEGVESGVDIYTLVKFARSNQNTCLNQTPLVKKGEYVTEGQILADGPCTDHGELALGRNLVVAYMPWRGYNFEDAILISERVVKEDLYTTIHIEEFEVHARDTKLGPEEITRDIPQVREEALKNLDDSGIIRTGATVRHGDILVGKVTPKGETILSPEEKLLRAIFGEKASDVKDASLTVPPGIEGTVVDIKVFTRKGQEKDLRTQQIERDQIAKWEKDLSDEERIIRAEAKKKIVTLLKGKELSEPLTDDKGQKELLPKGKKLTQNMLEAVSYHRFRQISVAAGKNRIETEVLDILDKTESQLKVLRNILDERMERLLKGDELMPGVLKTVKCYVAVKRKLQVGDKMAGRHGNKGVVSRILPVEDMPYLPDGRPVDIVLNPLGVPSRMNIGQVLECHLGWAGKTLGVHFSTPVFDGAREADIKGFLVQAWEKNHKLGPDVTGKTMLFDGMTGEAFEQPVNVGCVYMLKLHHLVDNKIHARSIGPYSLITQQPLGGKAQFGGQRFGEMEVWALEAYGAAHVLQELLTYKSDDMHGRTQIYQAIIKGETIKDPGLPESFNVVKKELNALCIDVEMLTREELDPGLVEEEPAAFSIEG